MRTSLCLASALAHRGPLAVLAGLLTAAATIAAVPPTTPVVETSHGKVQGLKDDGVDAYLGVRYGAPPVGDLRFAPPQAPEAWTGIEDATSLAAPCMQMYRPSGPTTTDFTRQIQRIFPTGGESKVDNEDCLFLNVWTPSAEAGAERPVMVWFHGGGYAYGSGGWPVYDGRNLSEKGDVVVVTVNHRLNLFGYLYLGDALGDDFASSGNHGNLDLVASLEWVRDNIRAFGGDPGNVTIFGESGGGSKVSHLLAMPKAAGLFHRAVVQSGPAVTSGDREAAAKMAKTLLAEAGVTTVEQLRAVPADHLIDAARAAMAQNGRGGLGPIVDGTALPRHPFSPEGPEQSKDVPVMIGWNKDEMTIFTASMPWFGRLTDEALDQMAGQMMGDTGPELIQHYRDQNPDYSPTHIASRAMGARFVVGSYDLADAKHRQGGAPVYMYRLTWETPVNGGMFKSPHTLEIPFVFDNAVESEVLVGSGPAPAKLADMLSDAWISFARTGVPSSDLLPEWTPYDPEGRMVMEFDLEPKMAADPEKGARELMGGSP